MPQPHFVEQQAGQQLLGFRRRSQRDRSPQVFEAPFATSQMQIHPAALFQCWRVIGVLLQGVGDGSLMFLQLRKRRDVRRRLRNQSPVGRDQIAEQLFGRDHRFRQQPSGTCLDARHFAGDQRQMQHAVRQDSLPGQRSDRHGPWPCRFSIGEPDRADLVGSDDQHVGIFRDPCQEQPLVAGLLPHETAIVRVQAEQFAEIRRSDQDAIARSDQHVLSPRRLKARRRRTKFIKTSHRNSIQWLAVGVLPTQFAPHRVHGHDRSRTGGTDDALADDRRTQAVVARHSRPDRIARRERLCPQQLAIAWVEHHQPQINPVIRQCEELPAPRQWRAEEIRSGSRQFVIAARAAQFPAQSSGRRFDRNQLVELARDEHPAPHELRRPQVPLAILQRKDQLAIAAERPVSHILPDALLQPAFQFRRHASRPATATHVSQHLGQLRVDHRRMPQRLTVRESKRSQLRQRANDHRISDNNRLRGDDRRLFRLTTLFEVRFHLDPHAPPSAAQHSRRAI